MDRTFFTPRQNLSVGICIAFLAANRAASDFEYNERQKKHKLPRGLSCIWPLAAQKLNTINELNMSHNSKNNLISRSAIRRYLWLAGSLGAVATVMSEGFRNPTIGTSDLGESGGRIADVGDPTAVQQNPANLVNVTNISTELTPSVIYISSDFHSSLGPQSASSTEPWKVLPNAFLSVPLDNDRFAVGFGLTSPFGLGNEWDTTSPAFAPRTGVLRYETPYSSELETVNLNPTLAVRLLDNLSLGVGLDAMWSSITLEQYYPSFLLGGGGDSNLKADGDGWGWGGNVGLTWDITDRQRLAVTYRSPMRVDYGGTFSINNLPAAAAAVGATPTSSFSSTVNFPTMVSAGYGIDITDKIHLESDFEWLEFSRFKSLDINAGNDAVLFRLLDASPDTPEDWHNTFTAGIGGDWQFAEHWDLRAGYQYFESPVPNSTFSPTIPDANQNVATIGIAWHNKHNSLEASYGLDFYNDRHITNDQIKAFDGTYSFNVHLLSFAYTYSF
ncbi:MAG TPA: outer membrane protein transport protein [Candidatus Acidoferrales bacterium]|nr:outer membrane protein transport protein [Candidatus Acidoferrales bacterium]